MDGIANIITFGLVGIIAYISYLGFNDRVLFDKYKFHVGYIRDGGEWYRFFTSAFLHGDWNHLLSNGISLIFCAPILIMNVSWPWFFAVYIAGLLAGHGLSLYMNRNNFHYTAIGASAAVSAVIFCAIALYPWALRVFFVIPGWIFGILYLGYSIYGIQNKVGNLGHEAHFGGAIAGMTLAFAINPSVLSSHPLIFIILFVLPLLALILYIVRPDLLDISAFKGRGPIRISQRKDPKRIVREDRVSLEYELNTLLDKLGDVGMKGLTASEKKRLNELSQVIQVKKSKNPPAGGGSQSDE